MMNVGNPDRAFDFASIPNHGVGLARLEFIINRMIGVHPRALLEFATLDPGIRDQVRRQMAGYDDPVRFFVEKLAEGIASIAAAFAPQPVIVRLSDFKSNEYANLIGGRQYEPHEENPMLGFRGASRYTDPGVRALLRARMPRIAPRPRRFRARPTSRSWCRSCERSTRAAASSSFSRRTASSVARTG